MVIHLHGQAADVERIARFCQKHDLRLIEDASQAAGASFLGKKVGSFGNISAFSLYATKNLATGEGGIIAFNNPSLRQRLSIYSNNGFYQGEVKEPLGDSLRMSDIHASIGSYYLKHLDELNDKRKDIAQYYNKRFEQLPILILPSSENNVFHHYNIVIKRDFPFSFQKAYSFFYKKGIRIKQYYPYTLSSFFKSNPSKTASFLTKNAFCIPMYPSLQEDEIKKIADTVIDYFGGSKS
jgi:dTDP-4-amino-4,6-dideoxygalactose transaminase